MDFRFYVQDLRLTSTSGEEVPVQLDEDSTWQTSGLALIDFKESPQGQCGSGNGETNTTVTGQVPEGQNAGVAFSNGVPAALNHVDPADPATPAPLRQSHGMQWNWLSGYRFIRAELKQVAASEDDAADAGALDSGPDGGGNLRRRKWHRSPGFPNLYRKSCAGHGDLRAA